MQVLAVNPVMSNSAASGFYGKQPRRGRGSGGILSKVLRREWRTMEWKNGGGITHELLRRGGGRGIAVTAAVGFDIRLSIAEVSKEYGSFSLFKGVDRTITLLRGKGFVLERGEEGENGGGGGNGRKELRASMVAPVGPGAHFSFMGEDKMHCTLVGGPVMNFNVMCNRGTRRACVYGANAGSELIGQGRGAGQVAGHVGVGGGVKRRIDRFLLFLEPGKLLFMDGLQRKEVEEECEKWGLYEVWGNVRVEGAACVVVDVAVLDGGDQEARWSKL